MTSRANCLKVIEVSPVSLIGNGDYVVAFKLIGLSLLEAYLTVELVSPEYVYPNILPFLPVLLPLSFFRNRQSLVLPGEL